MERRSPGGTNRRAEASDRLAASAAHTVLQIRVDAGIFDPRRRSSSRTMLSSRSHFWLRFVGLALILAAEFGPRLWSSAQPASTAPLEASVETR
jgi:hypothetical protein